jgi:heavy metal translocating P-type ATPase
MIEEHIPPASEHQQPGSGSVRAQDGNVDLTREMTSAPTPTASPASGRFQSAQSLLRTYPLPFITILLLLLSLGLWLGRQPQLAQWPLLVIVVYGCVRVAWDLLQQLRQREFGVDFIAALAIVGSLLLKEYLAGAIIVLMLSGGEALEAFALRRARTSLAALAQRAPRSAHLLDGDHLSEISADDVQVGMRLVVKPGEVIPVDSLVVKGSSNVSEADLTGEPLPVRKEPGAQVMSGSVNLDGLLQIQATRPAVESQYAQILRLMREAQEQKAPIHRLADRYSVGFTAVTLTVAGFAWLLSGDSMYALAVLVVATPCPLILATPIAIMSGINAAAHQGVILKSGAAIEQLGEAKVAVFDKTGTLTMGIPQLKTILRATDTALPTDDLLRLAASVEQFSAHILARAVVEAAQNQHLPLLLATDVQESFGKGVQGTVRLAAPDQAGELDQLEQAEQAEEEDEQDWHGPVATAPTSSTRSSSQVSSRVSSGVSVAVGNRTFMRQLDIAIPQRLQDERAACVARGEIGSFIAVDGQLVGLLILADLPRPELAQLSPALKQHGIEETILLTGDSQVVAERIGQLAQVDRVIAQCLPEDKVRAIRELVESKRGVLMVGDGINDAPALASASVGIAIGSGSVTAAASAADAVLVSTNMLRLVEVVRLGRWVMRVARQGIWVGMGLSGVAMLFAAFGFIDPAVGAVLQEGIDVIVILNALRAGHPR